MVTLLWRSAVAANYPKGKLFAKAGHFDPAVFMAATVVLAAVVYLIEQQDLAQL